ncbi:tRNA (adenosine(37)-N6)-dimethylallyltransferase MiaA [Kineosporia mesophila]|nr:tRNA (adenosine(37)-N6)-dimethylallyltransferase MiaA [Kineosporia mesophila]MCD5353192.1 tRNA (adenosine(37)-N6)-dimethylallyltransferase MiaA [Kineosporia mesophila]
MSNPSSSDQKMSGQDMSSQHENSQSQSGQDRGAQNQGGQDQGGQDQGGQDQGGQDQAGLNQGHLNPGRPNQGIGQQLDDPTRNWLTIAVVGATATGKSDLALDLAEALNGEVINADAMQLYRGMDIGTAKLPADERRGVPHHLLDVLDVTQEASLAAYQRDARASRDDILARGKVPILAGGSGLYVRAVLDQLEIPPTDPKVRLRLEREAESAGAPEMHRRLAAQDPAAAIAILPGNLRRIVRALEVIELTGRPFSATLPRPEYDVPAVQIGLMAPREELDDRIAARVVRMWRDGLVEETARLVSEGLLDGKTAPRALGYAQVLRMLDGEMDEVEAQVDTVNTTRKFARRQESWFRRDDRVTWLPYDADDLRERALAVVTGPRSLTP